jgi:hypothetical protein
MLRVIDFAKTVIASALAGVRGSLVGGAALVGGFGLLAAPAMAQAGPGAPFVGSLSVTDVDPSDVDPRQLNPGDILRLSLSIYQDDALYSPGNDMAFSIDLTTAYPGIRVVDAGALSRACDLPGPSAGSTTVNLTGMALADNPTWTSASCSIQFDVKLPDDIPAGAYTFLPGDLTGTYDVVEVGATAFTADVGDPSFTVVADTREPGVSLSTAISVVPNAPFDVGVVFDEPVSGFDASDIVVTGGTVVVAAAAGGGDGGGGLEDSYRATVTPTGEGTVTVQIPAASAIDAASNANTVSNLLTITVLSPPTVSFSILEGPVAPESTATLRMSMTNTHATDAISGGSVYGYLPTSVTGLDIVTPLPVSACATITDYGTAVWFGSISLAAGESCVVDLPLTVPVGAEAGNHILSSNSTGGTGVEYILDGSGPYAGAAVSTTLSITGAEGLGAPALFSKSFTDDPVLAGETVTLEYTIVPAEGFNASALTFTDDLDAALTGLAATGLPMSDVCGEGSTLSGSSTITLTGGAVADGSTCTFSVSLSVPAGSAGGTFASTTSALTGSHEDGNAPVALTVTAASDSLSVTALIPTVIVSGPAVDVGGAFSADIRFSQAVTGFELGDLTVTNGTASALTGSGTDYSVTITPVAVGATTVLVPADSAQNGVPTGNSVSNTFSANVVTPNPLIEVSGLGMEITAFDTTPNAADGTNFGSVGVSAGTLTRTFVIRNIGTGPLTLTGGSPITISGTGAANFSVVSQPSSPVPVNGSVSFQITYDPSALATDTATIEIANDSQCGGGTFEFDVQGTGISAPEIEVEGNSTLVADNDTTPTSADHTDFGSVDQGTSLVRTFTVNNTGGATLTLGANAVSLSGAGASDYSVTSQPATTIAPSGSTTFDISFAPSALGTLVASVSITNDDADESPYNFAITGAGTGGPEVDLVGSLSGIADGEATTSASNGTNFGSANIGGSVEVTFVIENNGTSDLTLFPAPIEVSGDVAGATVVDVLDSSVFAVRTRPTTTVAAGSFTTFVLAFSPTTTGTLNATVAFGSDDVDEGRYTFAVTGTGTAPEIDVTGLGVDVADGSTTTSATNGTILADAGVASGSSSRTFTINNTGNGLLTLGSDAVRISGTHDTDFSVTSQPATSVAAAGSTTFTVAFDPSATGVRSATVSIANDDADEAPFDFAIEGTGLDLTAPTGFSVAFDDSLINNAESSSASFTFTGAEVGTTYDYTISTSGGASTATGSAAVSSAGQTISGIDLSGLEDGTLTLSVTLTDAATNVGGPETDTSSLDRTAPTVALTTGSPDPVSGAFTLTATFSESVSGFVVGDFDVVNGAASGFSGSGSAYSATITPASDGAVTVDVAASVAADGAGNDNSAASQFSITNDGTAPTIALTTGSSDPVSGAFTLTANFSESVSGFDVGDLDVGNGAASGFSGSGSAYSATITPASDGAVTVDVAAGVAVDGAGNGNTAASQFSITNDETPPTIALTTGSSDPVSGAFTLTANFSESVSGFVVGDLDVGNGAASGFSGSGSAYSATITPASDGTVTVDVSAGVAVDGAGNGNTVAGQFSITNDETPPTVSLTSGASDPVTGAFTLTATFSETVTGFVVGDLDLGNATASDFSGSGTDFSVLITPLADGEVTVNVAADVATDAAGNGNTVATEFSIQADITSPTVTSVVVSDADVRLVDVGGAAFTVEATFSEALDPGTDPTLAFVGGDLSGTLLFQSGAFSSGDTVFTGTYTVADGGLNLVDVDVNVTGGADVAGNAVTGSTTDDLFSVEMRRGSITVTQNVTGSIDAEFDFTGDLGVFAITTVGQTGSELFDDLAEGSYSFATSDEVDFTRDSLACVGGTTTVDAVAGTVDVTMSPTDAVVCTFTSIAAPTIDVASLPTLALTLPTLVDDPTTITQTFAVGNLGGADFNFTAATDVTWMTIDPTSGTIPASGTLDFTIAFTAEVLDLGPGTYSANITITEVPGTTNRPRGDASHAGPIVIPVTITLDPRDGTLTIVTTTAPAEAGDGTFNYSSSLAALNGVSHTTVGGTASTAGLTVLRGTYTLTQATTEGWALDSMSCTGDVDGGSTFDVASGTMTIDLDATEVMVCTFANRRDEDYIVGITTAAIRDFMAQRADQILSNGPRLNRRFRGDRASATPNNFAADFREGRFNANFSTSLSAIRREVESNQPSVPGQYSTNLNEGTGLSTLDVWVQANFSSIEDNRAGLDSETSFGMYYIGADFLATENVMVGALMQFDSAETITGALNSEVEGDGWMAGPYVVARIDENLYLDARASWGGSENTINPIGLYTDDFETDRMLLEANLAGDLQFGNWRIRPEMGVAYFKETQDSYTDTLGFVIPSQEITLGRFSAGPEISYRIMDSQGGFIEPYVRMTGMWDYDDAEIYNAAGNLQGLGTFRADARLGINVEMANGGLISGEVSMQGLGVGDFEANSAMIHFRLPLTMDW